MQLKKNKVLIIATSPHTKGGITSVLNAHKLGEHWKHYHCKWIISHIDRNAFVKLFVFVGALMQYLALLPFSMLVHIHLSEVGSAIRKTFFLLPAILLKKKIIVHFHSFSPETTIKGRYSWLYKWIFNHVDVLIVLSNYWKREVNDVCNLGDKVSVIYNPCPEVSYNGQIGKEKNILYAGALNHRKGYADLIKAFARIAYIYPDWNLVLAGDGEIGEGKRLSIELGIEKQVIFLGWVSGANKDDAYKKASIFCLPSYAEGFPMAVLDAWSYGLPVITTPVGGIPDIAKDGENLMLFEPGDIDRLTDVLARLIADTKLRRRLSLESLNLARTTFNINTINSQIGNLYSKLIGK